MDDNWLRNNFLLGFSSVINHSGYLTCTSSGLFVGREQKESLSLYKKHLLTY
jgi:hypothetical protein